MNEFNIGEYFTKEYIQRGLIEPCNYRVEINTFDTIRVKKDGITYEFWFSHFAIPFMLYRLVRITEPNGRYKEWKDPLFDDDTELSDDLPEWIEGDCNEETRME